MICSGVLGYINDQLWVQVIHPLHLLRPFINHEKQKKLKEIRDREKAEERSAAPPRAKPVKSEPRRRA